MAIPVHLDHMNMPMLRQSRPQHLNHHRHLPRKKPHTMSPKTPAYNSLNLPSVETATPPPQPNKKTRISNTCGHSWRCGMVCHTHHLTTCICGRIDIDNITNLFKQCYILPPPYSNPCMHGMDSFNIHRLSHLTHAQQTKIGTHQWPCNSYLTNHQTTPHAYQNPKSESYNRMHASLTCIRDRLPQKLAPTIELNTWDGKYKHHPHNTHPWGTHNAKPTFIYK